ncbi:hypothetical protein [Halorubrum saccharovorum]|nr:hypothetical protein [Halorubrum saccharovorum]
MTHPESNAVTRRAFLASAAAVGAVAGSQSVTATHPEQKPDHVTVRYDTDIIERYQPALVLDGVEIEPYSYCAMVAESPERGLGCVVGFHRYTHQEGFSMEDSHFGDTEPAYVFFDSRTGDVVQVVYSGYHWYQASTWANNLDYVVDDRQRPILRVIPPHHHHTTDFARSEISDVRTDIPTSDLTERYPEWLEDDLEDQIRPGSVYSPWNMRDWEAWWEPSTMTEFEITLQRIWLAWEGVRLR